MDKNLTAVLNDLNLKIDRSNFEASKKSRYKGKIDFLVEKYREVNISDNHIETYQSLIKKGRELIKDNIKDEDKLKYYLRYCEAAIYDFEGNIKQLNIIVRMFLISCALFLVLAPQYFGPIFPLIFLVPAFIGLKGMKKRSLNGLNMALAVMPMALMTSIVCIRMTYLASSNIAKYTAEYAVTNKITEGLARNLIIGSGVFGVILLVTTGITIYMGFKNRKMFI